MMSFYKKIISINSIAMFLLMMLSFQTFSAVNDCRSSSGADSINLSVSFDITNSSSAIAQGATLATTNSSIFGLTCEFTGQSETQNAVYFKNTTSSAIKETLLNSGVEVIQRYTLGGSSEATITNATIPNMHVGTWNEKPNNETISTIGLRYTFTVKKGENKLKPFDTGVFLLGSHVDYQGRNIGAPIYIRIVGNLTMLCPSPTVNVTASNGGSVNFGSISPKQMNDGDAISRSFNLNMGVSQDCETGLNISVRFEPNNNTVINGTHLDMGNGLQTVLNDNNGEIIYDENYYIGEVLPSATVNLPYTATLTKIPGSAISSGPFSKTIRAVVSY